MRWKIKFEGKDTSKTITYRAVADSYEELFEELVKKRVCSYEKYDQFLYRINDVSEDTFLDENGEWDEEKYDEFLNSLDLIKLDEDDYFKLIGECTSAAYYQSIYVYDEQCEDYIMV